MYLYIYATNHPIMLSIISLQSGQRRKLLAIRLDSGSSSPRQHAIKGTCRLWLKIAVSASKNAWLGELSSLVPAFLSSDNWIMGLIKHEYFYGHRLLAFSRSRDLTINGDIHRSTFQERRTYNSLLDISNDGIIEISAPVESRQSSSPRANRQFSRSDFQPSCSTNGHGRWHFPPPLRGAAGCVGRRCMRLSSTDPSSRPGYPQARHGRASSPHPRRSTRTTHRRGRAG